MNASFFRKLLVTVLVLVAVTLAALDICTTHYLASQPPSAEANMFRLQILAIAFSVAMVSLAIAYFVSRSLALRISRLKQFAEVLLDQQTLERPRVGSKDELGSLELSLADLSAQIRELVDRWQLESARREAILSSMAEGVLAVDKDLRVIFCNEALAAAVNARRPVPERVPVLELVRDIDLLNLLTQVVRSGHEVKRHLKFVATNSRSYEVHATPLSTTGGRGAIAVLHDMTDLERLEQVRKDFVANVSHEFRTPLAAIVGYSETLVDGGLEDHAHNRKFLEIIHSNAIRLNSIASDLLVLSELEAGINPGEPEPISLRDILDNALGTVEAEARTRGVHLVRGDIEDLQVLGYKLRLEQALLNLMVNAVKFNRPGGEVRVEARQTPPGQIQIAVSDNGVGIPSQDLPRIFERFYRVDKAHSRQVGGTGLGLSIARHVVERMNGKISVESQLGRGSTFTVTLPSRQNGISPGTVTTS